MSKELTPLEALEEIRYLVVFDKDCIDEYGDEKPIKVFVDEICPKQYEIIETALKEYIKLKKALKEDLRFDCDVEIINLPTEDEFNELKEVLL